MTTIAPRLRFLRAVAPRVMTGALFAVSTTGAAATLSCGGEPPAKSASEVASPAWQDALDGNEAFIAVVRPKALLRDPVFGPLFRAGVAATVAREGSAPSLDVLSSAEELIVVFAKDPHDGTMLVLRGVDAARAPERVSDERGQALFRHGADARNVSEWVSTQGRETSLFVLPQRTWVIASSAMQKRARVSFANPAGRPQPTYGDDKALAVVRFDGPELVRSITTGRVVMPAIIRNLGSLSAELLPDNRGVNVTLHYTNDDQAGSSALAVEDVQARLAQDEMHRFPWAASAVVARDGNRDVRVHVDLPKNFADQMRRVSPQDLNTW